MQLLKIRLKAAGINCSESELLAFKKYHDLLLDWNERTNLVSKADQLNIEKRHFLESVAVLSAIEMAPGSNIVDVGSGAGFPSVPISLLRRDVNFLLVESKRKKTLFLKHIITQLDLKNVSALCERCEKLTEKKEYRGFFDFVFSRAVGKLDVIYGWVQNIMKPGAVFVAWKGGNMAPEISSFVKKYGNKEIEFLKMDERLVDKERERSLVIIK